LLLGWLRGRRVPWCPGCGLSGCPRCGFILARRRWDHGGGTPRARQHNAGGGVCGAACHACDKAQPGRTRHAPRPPRHPRHLGGSARGAPRRPAHGSLASHGQAQHVGASARRRSLRSARVPSRGRCYVCRGVWGPRGRPWGVTRQAEGGRYRRWSGADARNHRGVWRDGRRSVAVGAARPRLGGDGRHTAAPGTES